MIKVENLSFKYKNQDEETLSNVNLNITNGIWTLEGRNGSGKTGVWRIRKGHKC